MKQPKKFILAKTIGLYINWLSFYNKNKAKKLSYNIFSTPRKGKLNSENLPSILKYSDHATHTFNGKKIQTYIWTGGKQTVLLAHGWESNSARWKKLLHYLNSLDYTIIAIDAPAHGLSEGVEFNTQKYAEYINVIIKNYSPKILIGHSLGGVAISYYLHIFNNSDIEKIILLGVPSDLKTITDNFCKTLGLNNRAKRLFEDNFFEKFSLHISDFSCHLFAKNFSPKALIIHDLYDNIVSVEEGKKIAKAIKNGTFIETKGLGHSLHSKSLYQKIASFIQS